MVSKEDSPKDYARGLECELWGVAVPNMSQEQLIIFIGFLDRELTDKQIAVRRLTDKLCQISNMAKGATL